MEHKDFRRCHWVVAVMVSVLVHGTVVLCLIHLPSTDVAQTANSPAVSFFPISLLEQRSGDYIEFAEAQDAGSSIGSRAKKPPAGDNTGIGTSVLVEPKLPGEGNEGPRNVSGSQNGFKGANGAA